MEITIDLQYLIPIMALLGPPAFFVARHFWKKEKCFNAMQDAITYLSQREKDSVGQHDEYDERFDSIEKRQQKNETYLKLLLDHEKIKYYD